MKTGEGFTALSSTNCNVYDEHLSGKKNKNTYFHQGRYNEQIDFMR